MIRFLLVVFAGFLYFLRNERVDLVVVISELEFWALGVHLLAVFG
jgi:hypothetical protein